MLKSPGEYMPAMQQALREEAARILPQFPEAQESNKDLKEEIVEV